VVVFIAEFYCIHVDSIYMDFSCCLYKLQVMFYVTNFCSTDSDIPVNVNCLYITIMFAV